MMWSEPKEALPTPLHIEKSEHPVVPTRSHTPRIRCRVGINATQLGLVSEEGPGWLKESYHPLVRSQDADTVVTSSDDCIVVEPRRLAYES